MNTVSIVYLVIVWIVKELDLKNNNNSDFVKKVFAFFLTKMPIQFEVIFR